MSVIRTISMSEADWSVVKQKGLSPSSLIKLGLVAHTEAWQMKVEKVAPLLAENQQLQARFKEQQDERSVLIDILQNTRKILGEMKFKGDIN